MCKVLVVVNKESVCAGGGGQTNVFEKVIMVPAPMGTGPH